jgi:hypothetical protein
MTCAVLPEWLRPCKVEKLIRLGRDNDGGYLIDFANLAQTDLVLSFGVYEDWSFEEQFRSSRNVPIVAFDHSIGAQFFFRRILNALRFPDHPSMALERYLKYRRYKRFFVGDVRHVPKMVGQFNDHNYTSVEDIVKDYKLSKYKKKVFVKCDIEGHEYRILDALLASADLWSGIALEFHDVDLHFDKIASFVRRLPLRLCHVHGNNFGPLLASGAPSAIECSFTSGPTLASGDTNLPHELDQPNDPAKPDYRIAFQHFKNADYDYSQTPSVLREDGIGIGLAP